ncbi:Non-specific lipid-transfer protein 1 [Linum perenne]
MKSLPIILAAIIAVAAATVSAAHPKAVSCDQVVRTLIPCLPYLTAAGGVGTTNPPSTGCCDGVRSLKKMAEQSPEDKRATCECLKEAATRSQKRIKAEVAAQLPKLCAVDVSVPISKDVDCTKLSAAPGN